MGNQTQHVWVALLKFQNSTTQPYQLQIYFSLFPYSYKVYIWRNFRVLGALYLVYALPWARMTSLGTPTLYMQLRVCLKFSVANHVSKMGKSIVDNEITLKT